MFKISCIVARLAYRSPHPPPAKSCYCELFLESGMRCWSEQSYNKEAEVTVNVNCTETRCHNAPTTRS